MQRRCCARGASGRISAILLHFTPDASLRKTDYVSTGSSPAQIRDGQTMWHLHGPAYAAAQPDYPNFRPDPAASSHPTAAKIDESSNHFMRRINALIRVGIPSPLLHNRLNSFTNTRTTP